MIIDFVNVKSQCDNSNTKLKKYKNACSLAEFILQVQRQKTNQQQHRYGCWMIVQAGFQITLQQADEAPLHTAARTIKVQQCPGGAG